MDCALADLAEVSIDALRAAMSACSRPT